MRANLFKEELGECRARRPIPFVTHHPGTCLTCKKGIKESNDPTPYLEPKRALAIFKNGRRRSESADANERFRRGIPDEERFTLPCGTEALNRLRPVSDTVLEGWTSESCSKYVRGARFNRDQEWLHA